MEGSGGTVLSSMTRYSVTLRIPLGIYAVDYLTLVLTFWARLVHSDLCVSFDLTVLLIN